MHECVISSMCRQTAAHTRSEQTSEFKTRNKRLFLLIEKNESMSVVNKYRCKIITIENDETHSCTFCFLTQTHSSKFYSFTDQPKELLSTTSKNRLIVLCKTSETNYTQVLPFLKQHS